jgi:hypothetical protein
MASNRRGSEGDLSKSKMSRSLSATRRFFRNFENLSVQNKSEEDNPKLKLMSLLTILADLSLPVFLLIVTQKVKHPLSSPVKLKIPAKIEKIKRKEVKEGKGLII